jgi:putative membrane protein
VTAFLFGGLLVLGVVLLVVTAVRVLVGGLEGSDQGRLSSEAAGARKILDERYAAGELSTEEYEHRRRVLGEEDT